MPRSKSLIPKLCIDKSRNRAFCKVDGKFVVLGPVGSAEAQLKYGQVLKAIEERRDAVQAVKSANRFQPEPKLSLNDLFLRFVSERLPKYSRAEQRCIKAAIRTAREMYGESVAEDFDVLRLRAVRAAMIRKGWSPAFVNKQIKRLRTIVRWGVSWKLVPQTLADSLGTVESLEETESRPRRAVSDADLRAVREKLSGRNRDIYDLLLLTGARPGEIINLTTGQIDRSGEIWRAVLLKHKTAHKGKRRVLFFNKSAQLVLRKYLSADPDARLFPGARGDRFSDAMKIACEEAFGMPQELRSRRRHRLTPEKERLAREWHRKHGFTPHFLRHTVATRLADELGTEAAQRLLGHATRAMTEHYSRAAERLAVEAVKRLG